MKMTRPSSCRAATRKRGRDGAILAAVLIVMVLVGIAGLALMQLGEFNGLETVRQGQKNQAFWSAEAGVQHMVAALQNPNYRNDPANGPPYYAATNLAGMTYQVIATTLDTNSFTLTSTGTVGMAQEVVRQTIVLSSAWPAFSFGIYAIGTNTIKPPFTINGEAYVSDGLKSGGTNVYSATNPPPSGIPDPPPPPTNAYSGLISAAAATGSVVGAAITNLTLYGGTNWYKGDVGLKNGISGSGGAIVVSGNLTISSTFQVTNNIAVIAGGRISVGGNFVAGTNCLIYAGSADNGNGSAKAIYFDQNATIGTASGGSVMITPGGIYVKQNLIFYGLLFLGGELYLNQDATIEGCLIAEGGVYIKNELTATYNKSLIPDDLENYGFTPVTKVVTLYWQQIFKQE